MASQVAGMIGYLSLCCRRDPWYEEGRGDVRLGRIENKMRETARRCFESVYKIISRCVCVRKCEEACKQEK